MCVCGAGEGVCVFRCVRVSVLIYVEVCLVCMYECISKYLSVSIFVYLCFCLYMSGNYPRLRVAVARLR